MKRASPSEEDDLQNQIDQDSTHQPRFDNRDKLPTTVSAAAASSRSTFHEDGNESRIGCRFKKQYFFPIVFVLAFVLAYVYLSGFQSDSVSKSDLRALYLLREQQLFLLSLLNRTHSNTHSSTSNFWSSDSSALIEDVKSSVLKQISLNKQIQQSLLSAQTTNSLGNSDVLGDRSGGRCRKLDQKLLERRTIEWKPEPNKFLFAICVSGQMSSHLNCLEKHVIFAALLNRVLIIPSPKFDYDYSKVVNMEHINACVGRKVVVSFNEFIEKKHGHIDRFICYFSSPQSCYLDDYHLNKLRGLGISIGMKLGAPWEEGVKRPSKSTVRDVEAMFRSDDDVIAIGDVFYANLEGEWVVQPGGPIAHKCKSLIEPSRLILLTAQKFVQTFLGKSYVALHFRRDELLKFCAKRPSCLYPILQAADCIVPVVEMANTPVVYLSTDAADGEMSLLQSLMVANGKSVPFVRRPDRDSAEKWDALLYRHGLEGDPQVEEMLDKAICTMSSVFIGASESAFTEGILRLRKDWATASTCDGYLCQGQKPNFIAEEE